MNCFKAVSASKGLLLAQIIFTCSFLPSLLPPSVLYLSLRKAEPVIAEIFAALMALKVLKILAPFNSEFIHVMCSIT